MKIKVSKLRIILHLIFFALTGTVLAWVVGVLFVSTDALKNPLSLLSQKLELWQKTLISIPYCLAFIFSLIAFVKNSLVDDDYGDARLATLKEAKNLLHCVKDKGIIWGKKWGRFIRTDDTLSALLLAPPGTGKTMSVAVPTLLSCQRSMIINDIKGELWNMTSKQRATFGDVGIFAPTIGLSNSLKFNPIGKVCCPKDYKKAFQHMDLMAEAIYPTADTSGAERHFNAEAKQYFIFWAMYLHHCFYSKEIKYNKDVSLPVIYDEGSEGTQDAIAMILDDYPSLPREVYKLGFAISEKDAKDFGQCQTTFLQGIRPFWQPALREQFEDCDITASMFRQTKPFSLYITIPPRDMDSIAPIIRMLSLFLVYEFISEPISKIKQDVFFLLDEFARLGRVSAIVNAPEISRGFKVNFLFIAQSEAQVQTLYGGNGVDAIQRFNDVCAYTIIFTQNTQTTAEKLSKLIANVTVKKKSRSGRDLDMTGSTSESKEARPLFSYQQILNLSQNKAIFISQKSKERPVFMDKMWVFKDPMMMKLCGAYEDRILGEEYASEDEIKNTEPLNVLKSDDVTDSDYIDAGVDDVTDSDNDVTDSDDNDVTDSDNDVTDSDDDVTDSDDDVTDSDDDIDVDIDVMSLFGMSEESEESEESEDKV